MYKNNFEFKVVVGKKSITEYQHEGNTFIEGRKGSEFILEFKNNLATRVLVIPCVDGVSTLEGTPATEDSKGYIVGPNATLSIPGWTLDNANVAKFFFQDKEKSYASQAISSGSTNAGAIGALVYKEKVEHVTPTPYWAQTTTVWPYNQPSQPSYPPGVSPYGSTLSVNRTKGMSDAHFGMAASASASVPNANVFNVQLQNTVSGAETVGAMGGAALPQNSAPFELGTGFGKKAEFKTTDVSFNRGDLAEKLVIYYDSRRNLTKRGIQVVKYERQYLNELPDPFPTVGCKPPPGWKG
jgi:hypothetical protein